MLLENEVANMTLDLIGEAVLRTDAQSHITYLNRMAEDMTGWRRDEARGHPVAEVLRIIESVSGTAFVTVAGMVAQTEKTTAEIANCRDCRLVRRDGFEFGVDIKVAPIFTHTGAVPGPGGGFKDGG